MSSKEFIIKLDQHGYMHNQDGDKASYFVSGMLTTDDHPELMLTCGLENDHSATTWLKRQQVLELINKLLIIVQNQPIE